MNATLTWRTGRSRVDIVLRLVLLLAVIAMLAWQPGPAVADDLVRVIVRSAGPSGAAMAVVRGLGGEVLMELPMINAFVATVPGRAIARLTQSPGVLSVTPDGPLMKQGHFDPSEVMETLTNTYNLSVGADVAWAQGITGQGITVAIVDSGVEKRTAHGQPGSDFGQGKGKRLKARVSVSHVSHNPRDRYGHGTAVAGIIGGDGAVSGGQYVGIAPEVDLVSVKIGGDDGTGYESDLIAGLQWIYDHKDQYNIRVVNLSVTGATPMSYHESPIDAAVEILWFNGIVVVVAAGNAGETEPGALYPPANDPFVITVGAVNEEGTSDLGDDTMLAWSSWGTDEAGGMKPDIVAPGARLVTTLAPNSVFAEEHPERIVDETYFRFSGTSASAAVVAGAVALLLQHEPGLNPDQVKYRLWATARSWPGMPGDGKAGHGYLSLADAINATTTESANVGITISRFLTPPGIDVAWNGVNWGGVNWGGVNWGGVNWGSVNWGSVNWGGVLDD
ncbi:MAG: hypothetical protein Kow0047_17340 [Anaerolineae bacterium]